MKSSVKPNRTRAWREGGYKNVREDEGNHRTSVEGSGLKEKVLHKVKDADMPR